MRRSVKSHSEPVPVDAHERTRDYITEEEFLALVGATRQSRHHWRDAAMLMLTFYHGLRVSELCHLQCKDIELKHGRLWVGRVKGSLSTEQPLFAEELRALKRYLKERSDSQLPWLFLTERGDQFTRFSINYLVRTAGRRAGLALK
jgi:type 1 fimbriae regulatory protein FimB